MTSSGILPFNSFTPPAYREILVGLIDNYVRDCLAYPEVVPNEGQRILRSTVGVLHETGFSLPIRCAVTRLHRRLALTARHCVYPPPCDGTSAARVPQAGSFSVRFLDDPSKEIKVKEIRHPGWFQSRLTLCDASRLTDDWVLLTLEDGSPAQLQLPRQAAAQGQRLVLGSYQPSLETAMLFGPPSRRREPNAVWSDAWQSIVRVDTSAMCRTAIATSGGCLSHACQSLDGVSGAPLIALTSDGAVLGVVGMHTRANKGAGACSQKAAEEELNGGLALPAEVITVIKAMEPN
jgi:hypothetical protein